MIELLMCITLVCFNKSGDWKYFENDVDNKTFIISEIDKVTNIITFESYNRYRTKYNNKEDWWACYEEKDLLDGITMRN